MKKFVIDSYEINLFVIFVDCCLSIHRGLFYEIVV